MSSAPIQIQMLGGFAIVEDQICLEERSKRTSKSWKLLQYLVAHRHYTVSQNELRTAFWPDGDEGGSAMRNMVHRLRTMLEESGISHGEDLILSNNGAYIWNNAIPCVVDIEEFEKLYVQASSISSAQDRLELLMQAIDLYKGDFLPTTSSELWAIPVSSYYRSMFIKCVHAALELLTRAKRIDDAETLCAKALRIDRFDEKINEYYLRSLLAQGKQLQAHDVFKNIESMFYEEMGVSPSESLREVHRQILWRGGTEEFSISNVMNEWRGDADFPGAFYCDYSVFRTIYQVEARSILRSKKSVYIICFETKKTSGQGARDSRVVKQLFKVIPDNLRQGDLFTRAGNNQYMIMLQNISYENCKMLSNRILHSLDAKDRAKIIRATIKPVTPIA
ncbi:MAG: winged helix-turn-helix domain-containing protein [Clostridiales bacterium]|nr:winged helix-turn-helix domain-containing protein [Clostridiales bacterium]